MKKFVALAVLTCMFSLAFAANPAHAQLLRRNRGVINDGSTTYVNSETVPASVGAVTGSQPLVSQDSPYRTRPYRIFGRRTGRFAFNRGYSGSNYVRPVGMNGSTTNLALNTRRSNYSPPEQMVNAATIRVQLTDPTATVTFEDSATKQTGRDRIFASPPLEPNRSYTYTVRATWMENGEKVTRTKDIKVQAGREATVDFRDESK